MESIGQRIRKLREMKNMTQTELSQSLGMKTYTTVSKWESDNNFPKGKDLKRLAEIFNVSSDYLLGLDNIDSKPTRSIETIYNQLEDSRQKEVYDFAEYHLKEQETAAANSNKVIPLKEKKKETKDYLKVVAAHIDDDATEEELDEIKAFIDSLTKED